MIHVYNVYKREYLHKNKCLLLKCSLLIIKDDRIYYLEDQ